MCHVISWPSALNPYPSCLPAVLIPDIMVVGQYSGRSVWVFTFHFKVAGARTLEPRIHGSVKWVGPMAQMRSAGSQTSVAETSMDKATSENGTEEVQLLPFYDDEHQGIIVEMKEPMDPDDFGVILRYSLSQWKLQEKKGVWIKLPIQLVNLVEIAVKLLVVQERLGRLRGTGIWKIPTGILEEGEDIFSGARREVKEETGIDTEFMNVLAFRQYHKSFFQKSTLLFLCMLRPLSFDIQIQDSEIEAAQWMPITEYAAQTFPPEYSIFKHAADICLAKVDKGYAGFSPLPITSSFNDQISHLYVNKEDLNL
ncbi:UNVERIFIED_CONTAM: Nudix hydrolase 10 [Sesamum radiatum]|uniref:Nudix hydrolase 10 n=1 Tax=Sesamum radiatum TaxID=300843 RepID=A0AAW2T3Y7_SESRA